MVSADFDEDGVPDLLIGSAFKTGGTISLMRGSLDAIAPQARASWIAAGRHELTVPFLEPAERIRLAEVPDMLAAADVNGDGHLDLVYASGSSSVLHVMFGTGTGTFLPNSISFTVPGNITALAAYRPGAPVLGEVLVVGYKSAQGPRLSIVSYGKSGTKIESTYALPGAATAFSIANLDDDPVPDTAIVAGGQLLVLHGRNALTGAGTIETLPVDGVEAVASGEYLFDRHGPMQLAALTADGDVLILAHQGIDSRPFTPKEIAGMRHLRPGSPTLAQLAGNIASEPWTVVETDPQVAAHPSGSQLPILLRSRMSGSGGDDVIVLNPSAQQRVTISHRGGTSMKPVEASGRTSAAGLSTSDELVAAVAVRVSADGRTGLAMLQKNGVGPEFTVPSAGNTFYVNTTADNTGATTDTDDGTRCTNGSAEVCTLRDAVTFANSDASDNIGASKSDTIMVPAGTYPLTWQAGSADANGNAMTHLEVLGPVTFVGSTTGAGVTINAMNNDVAFSINPGLYGSFNPSGDSYVFDTTLENITIENGTNTNNLNLNPNANGVGGGINWDAFGTGNLTLINVIIQNCLVQFGPGGGLWIENSAGSGTGTVTLTGGAISSNATAEEGGGIYVASPYAALAATNTTISANTASPSAYSSDPGGFGAGGGIYFAPRTSTSASPQSTLNGVKISSNYAAQQGAGIYTNSGILLQNSVVSSNTSGNWGGGVYAQEGAGETSTTITNTNILSNSATTTGGGVFVGDDNPSTDIPSLTMGLTRIFGNTSGGTTGVALQGSGAAAATENWWGCNAGPANEPCDQADSAAVTNPWAVLGLSATPATVVPGNSIKLTVSLNSDSNGQSITGAFPAVNGDGISLNITGVTASPALTSGIFASTGTYAATLTPATAGIGTFSATFDNQTVPLTFISAASATMISPTPGSTLTSPAVTFNWSAAAGATSYDVWLGTTGIGSNNLWGSGSTTATSVTFGALPTNGATIYVRLWTTFGTLMLHADYTYTAASQAVMTSPTPGSTLAGPSATFKWTAGTGATSYYLWLGTIGVGSNDLYDSGATTANSVTLGVLPTNGETIYARLFTTLGGVTVHSDYTYTAAAQAEMTSPTTGSALPGPSVTFTWTSVSGATSYDLWLGTTGVGSNNLWGSGATSATSITFGAMPTNGVTIYARLFTNLSGSQVHADYTYTAASVSAMTAPAPGSTFTGKSATFQWTSVTGATGYDLWLGTTGAGSNNLWGSGVTTATSIAFGALPTNGEKIYVRLFTFYSGSSVYTDYTYTAASQAALTSPVPGSTLTGSSETFTWMAVSGATEYDIWLGSTGVGSNNLGGSGVTTATSYSKNGLPTNGEKIYVRLFTFYNGGSVNTDYTYTAASQAVLTSPVPSSTLTGSSETFTWTAVSGATEYDIWLGSTGVGSNNLGGSGVTTATSYSKNGLPTNGEKIYVRLFTFYNGSSVHADFTYTAY